MKRVKVVHESPNGLFLQWLTEFRDEARSKGNSGLNKIYTLCIENLSKYPLPLENGLQCKIIQGFGNTICKRLESKLTEYRSRNAPDSPDLNMSPVLQPKGQITSTLSKSSTVCHNKSSQHSIRVTSHEIEDDVGNFIKCNYSEEEDYRLALQLSQEENLSVRSDEEGDREMALRLQEKFNRENLAPSYRTLSPPRVPFSFDEDPVHSTIDNNFYDEDDLPDIPDVIPPKPTRQNLSPLKTNSPELNGVSFISPRKVSVSGLTKAGTSRQKGQVIHDISVVSDDEDFPEGTIKKKASVKSPGFGRKDKVYVPRERSGAYAVLVTLYHEKAKDEYRGFVSKAFLQEAAQPLADESLSLTSKSEHYTAWSGVTTLIKHGLVAKWSNPAKFDITDKGVELAARILAVEKGGTSEANILQSQIGSPEHKRERISSLEDADILRKKRINKFDKPNVNLIIDNVEDSEEEPDNDLRRAIKLSMLEADKSKSGSEGASKVNFDLGDTFNFSDIEPGNSSKKTSVNVSASTSTNRSNFNPSGKLPMCLQLQQMYNKQLCNSVSETNSHTPEFVMPAGSYDVILCVDNTETTGGGVGGRKTLKEETVRHLQRCGVMYDRRNLNIGDFLWIARERVAEVRGQYQQRQPRELVLPYIVERKRLDDLWQSVKDGRYEEQKFRLKGCGLTHLYYLIEDFPTKREFWGRAGGGALVTPEAIEQAVANTAVQEGFSVKKTPDQKGTIEYITLITRLLRRKYEARELSSCSQSDISEGRVGARDTTLLPFTHFNETSRKSKDLSVGEVWAKMLLRMKGLSVEMAQTLVTHFPTPRHMVEAFNKCSSSTEKGKLISDLTYGLENKRKIPKSIAEALMKVWNNASLS